MISKVALSVCALVVVGILGGAMKSVIEPSPTPVLNKILTSFDVLLRDLMSTDGASAVHMTVPSLPDGERLTLTIAHNLVVAHSSGASAYLKPSAALHTWDHHGLDLNFTTICELDSSAKPCSVDTGESLTVSADDVSVDGLLDRLVFVRASDAPCPCSSTTH